MAQLAAVNSEAAAPAQPQAEVIAPAASAPAQPETAPAAAAQPQPEAQPQAETQPETAAPAPDAEVQQSFIAPLPATGSGDDHSLIYVVVLGTLVLLVLLVSAIIATIRRNGVTE